MGPPLAGALLARSMFGGTRMFNLTITNVPGDPQRLYAFGAPLLEVLPLVPLFAGHTVGIAVVTYAGQMVFGLNADSVAAPDVEVLAEGIRRTFTELHPPRPRAHGAARRSRSPRRACPVAVAPRGVSVAFGPAVRSGLTVDVLARYVEPSNAGVLVARGGSPCGLSLHRGARRP